MLSFQTLVQHGLSKILSLAMVNAKKTALMATQVANNGMAMGAAFIRMEELEKEVFETPAACVGLIQKVEWEWVGEEV